MEVTSLRQSNQVYRNDKMSSKPENTKDEAQDSVVAKDSYIPSDSQDKKVTYGRPHARKDDVSVQDLMDTMKDTFSSLKSMVMDQVRKQANLGGQSQFGATGDFSFDEQTQIQGQLSNISGGGNGQTNSFTINEQTHIEVHFSITSSSQNGQISNSRNHRETPEEAQAAIAPGGEFSAENVSDNILKFAEKISGGDKTKLDKLRAAIEEGFKQAKEMLGGKLPDVCEQTYKLVSEKLDKWGKESDTDATKNAASGTVTGEVSGTVESQI